MIIPWNCWQGCCVFSVTCSKDNNGKANTADGEEVSAGSECELWPIVFLVPTLLWSFGFC